MRLCQHRKIILNVPAEGELTEKCLRWVQLIEKWVGENKSKANPLLANEK
jgi:hypothetical protein